MAESVIKKEGAKAMEIGRRTAIKKRISVIIFLVTVAALLAAVACGGSSTAPVPTEPSPTETPVKGPPPAPPDEPKTVVTPAPIEDTTLVASVEPGGQYILKVTSGLPDLCAQFNEYNAERTGNGFDVDVTNLMPDPSEPIACTEIYCYHESEIVLGMGLEAGQAHTVTIVGELTYSFTVQDAGGMATVEKESAIDEIKWPKPTASTY